jgi:hypothetical protein
LTYFASRTKRYQPVPDSTQCISLSFSRTCNFRIAVHISEEDSHVHVTWPVMKSMGIPRIGEPSSSRARYIDESSEVLLRELPARDIGEPGPSRERYTDESSNILQIGDPGPSRERYTDEPAEPVLPKLPRRELPKAFLERGDRYQELQQVKDALYANGWCCHRIAHFEREFDLDTLSYFSKLAPFRQVSHERCKRERSCVAFTVNPRKYQTRHTVEGCICSDVPIPYDQLKRILEAGDVPLRKPT